MTKIRTPKPKAQPAPEPTRPLASEAEVLPGVLDALRLYGIDPSRRNTGGMTDHRGQYVAFGEKGDADIQTQVPEGWGAASGKCLHIETKHEGFDPGKLSGKKREHFDEQLAKLAKVNANGGFGVWVSDPAQMVRVLERIKEGWRVVFVGDWPFLDDGKD